MPPSGGDCIVSMLDPNNRVDFNCIHPTGTNQEAFSLDPAEAGIEKIDWNSLLPSPDSSKIAFLSIDPGNANSNDINILFTDTMKVTHPVKASGQYYSGLQWKPGSATLSFKVGDEFLLVDTTTGEHKTITAMQSSTDCYTWSPDGSNIVYQEQIQKAGRNQTAIKRYNMVDGTPTILAGDMAFDYGCPVRSPAGDSIVYAYKPAGVEMNNLVVMDSNGENSRQITTYTDVNLINHITWSPDSKEIAFTRCYGGEYHPCELNILHMTDDKTIQTVFGYDFTIQNDPMQSIHWSPDGKILGFSCANSNGRSDIYTVHADGSGLKTLTGPGLPDYYNENLFWLGDSRSLVFMSSGGPGDPTKKIYRINTDGTGLTYITDGTLLGVYPWR
jgi:Tol biopolymer transport system component